jgi:hypothetical protein
MNTRRTWLLIILLLALTGFWLYQKYKPESSAAEADATPTATVKLMEFLLPKEEGIVTSMTITSRDGTSVALKRAGADWIMTQPESAKADPAAVEAAASQLTTITIVSHLDLNPSDAGLSNPSFIFTIGLSSGNSIMVEIGDLIPIGNGYYARKEDGGVTVISQDGVDVLTAMLASPPYAETPTPSPTPAPTGTPTPVSTDIVPVSSLEMQTATKAQ